MLSTTHTIHHTDSRDLNMIDSDSVDLVVTSPPYPMIEMWDRAFADLNPHIRKAIDEHDGRSAFELMHQELDKVWSEVARVMKTGAWACINIGDATRKVGDRFQLYSNHTRITNALFSLGLDSLPVILWRKQTNAPNKFMGSGMLPAGAYVTLEHEYILVFRKGNKRVFSSPAEKQNRQTSSFFWEERNIWFSDIWDFKGIRQPLSHSALRDRSAAFPFELAYRLVNMYSVHHDTVLDPFLGTGTTSFAAIASCRNSIGVEIDDNFDGLICSGMDSAVPFANYYVSRRLNDHLKFIQEYEERKGKTKHLNSNYSFPVVTSQEVTLALNYVREVLRENGTYRATYEEDYSIRDVSSSPPFPNTTLSKDQLTLSF